MALAHIVHGFRDGDELLTDFLEFYAIDNVLIHVFIEETRSKSDLNSGLNFIAC